MGSEMCIRDSFSPIKKSRTDFIIEKCVELGVKTIIPIISDYTDIHNFGARSEFIDRVCWSISFC